MDKLTKEFKSGEVLKAQDLNSIKDKINELVEGSNSGSGTTITVDSSLSTTSTNPVQNKVITEELNKKVNSEAGKGLSTNDFDNEYKLKVDNMSGGGVASTTEKGFFVCDSNGNIAFRYDSNGFDAAELSTHFKSLLQINIGSKWKGKTINVLGDSNTQFGKYTTPLAKLLQCTLNNYGVTGTRIASAAESNTDCFVSAIQVWIMFAMLFWSWVVQTIGIRHGLNLLARFPTGHVILFAVLFIFCIPDL